MQMITIHPGKFMRPVLAFCLFSAIHSASAQAPADANPPVPDFLKNLPEIVLDRKTHFDGAVHPLPPDEAGLHRHGFAFKTPNLVDGPATWLVVWDHEDPTPSPWIVTKPDGSPLDTAFPESVDLANFPALAARYPDAKSIQRVRVENRLLVKATRYQAVLSTRAEKPPLGILINVARDGVGVPPGTEVREMEIPEGFIPAALVMELVDNIRTFRGDAEAIAFLEAQFAQKAGRGGEFSTLFTAVWHEAQFGTGMTDGEWGSRLNDAAFVSALRVGARRQAFEILNNLCARLGGAGRYGRLAEVQAIYEDAYQKGGQNMDPTTFRDLGPAIPSLPVIRHRDITLVTPFYKPKPGTPPGDSRLSAIEASSLHNYAFRRVNRGDWRGGIEWMVWLRDWASDEQGLPIQPRNETWYNATLDIAGQLDNLGFIEDALALIEEAVAAPYGRNYRGRAKISVSRIHLDLLRRIGRPDPETIPKLREIITTMENHVHFGRQSAWTAKINLAKALFDAGQFEEGDRLIEEIIAEGSHSARWTRLDRWLETGRTEGVEAELISLLKQIREGGLKVSELWLYDRYASFLETTGRLQEALAMRQAAVRLARDFNAFTRLPEHLAKLAVLLQKLGHKDLSAKAAEEARALIAAGNMPKSTLELVNKTLADIAPAAPAPVVVEQQPAVDLQPHRGIVVPLAGAPWSGYLTLTNPGTTAIRGTLDISGPPHVATAGGENGDVRVDLGAGNTANSALELVLDPGSYRLITVAADAVNTREGEITFAWRSAAGDPPPQATMLIDKREEGVAGAVIQAGDYQANPFYGVPIHLAYAANDARPQSPPIRFKASQAARIEIHLLDGTPLAVDGTGNGSLLDSGDELFTATDGAGNLCIALANGVAPLRIIAYPREAIAPDGLLIDIEVLDGGEWSLHSRNKIEP